MKDDPTFKGRVERAEARINENMARYVEKHDKARKDDDEQAPKRARSDVATGSGDPLPAPRHDDDDGDEEMGLPQAASSSTTPAAGGDSWQRLADRLKRGHDPDGEGPSSQRRRLDHVGLEDLEEHYVMPLVGEDAENALTFPGVSMPWDMEDQ